MLLLRLKPGGRGTRNRLASTLWQGPPALTLCTLLQGWREAPIAFPPTFKFKVGTHMYLGEATAGSFPAAEEEEGDEGPGWFGVRTLLSLLPYSRRYSPAILYILLTPHFSHPSPTPDTRRGPDKAHACLVRPHPVQGPAAHTDRVSAGGVDRQ